MLIIECFIYLNEPVYMIVILLNKKIQEYMYVYRKNSYQKFDQKLKKTRYYYCNSTFKPH